MSRSLLSTWAALCAAMLAATGALAAGAGYGAFRARRQRAARAAKPNAWADHVRGDAPAASVQNELAPPLTGRSAQV